METPAEFRPNSGTEADLQTVSNSTEIGLRPEFGLRPSIHRGEVLG
jgi:hypothetical protein